ncbi:MAG: RNHCP domain-containing protein [Patescibacteria group bacterium]
MKKLFQKKVEDFTCEHCGNSVVGDGFTNHCPKCLWSKHVDVNPGDRDEICGGLMKPVSAIKKGEQYSVIQQCVRCGFERKNKVLPTDNFDALLALAQNQ